MMIVSGIICVLLCLTFKLSTIEALNIAVIGAGPSGLASAKNAIEQAHTVEIFEKEEALGGAWYYTDKTGKNIYSPMYENYRSNMPFQVLQFPDFQYPKDIPSYPPQKIVWNYLNSYAEKYDIKPHINYHHLVQKVLPLENDKWEVSVKNLVKNKTKTNTYDAVFVCSGACSLPYIPKIKGAQKYRGQVIHSHDFRKPEQFLKENVLVIGSKPCGSEYVKELRGVATQIIRSNTNHSNVSPMKKIIEKAQELNCFNTMEDNKRQFACDETFSIRGDVKRFTGPYEVEFESGLRQNFTVVIYATGYRYSYPFLDKSIGIRVKNNRLEPLYKHILSIEHPTLAFIGIPVWELHFRMYDLQSRFALAYMVGDKELPPKPEMIKEMQSYPEIRTMIDCAKIHSSFSSHKDYYLDLARTAEIINVRVVFSELYADALLHMGEPEYRDYKYIVIGNDFYRVKEE